jgi:two-component system, NtrC family, nitrogen regulation sensor histidine kinase NtrY
MRLRLRHENRVLALALLSGLPALGTAALLLWRLPLDGWLPSAAIALLVAAWLAFALAARRTVERPLQTLVNLLSALREGDFGFRAHVDQTQPGALADVQLEVNALATTLQQQRMWATEATLLLRKVMDAVDVAVFAFDDARKLRLINRAGESLLGEPSERALARTADDLGLAFALTGDGSAPRIVDVDLPGGGGRWEIRHGDFRQGGLPLDLVVLSNVSRALREEERQAWQRLVRVLSHELNNSLAPIRSIAGSLTSLLAREPRPDDWLADAQRGLAVVGSRAEALTRFLQGYATLARLPAPRLASVDLAPLVERVARLETRLRVAVTAGPRATIEADSDQIEQLLINLLRNAAEAALMTGGKVEVGWRITGGPAPVLALWIDDDGPGIANSANLFVPFFTTKPQGSGIGLALARQVAEAHGGTLTLANRESASGARALLRLPLRTQRDD